MFAALRQQGHGDMRRSRQTKAIDVERGLLLVRYATAEGGGSPPRVEIEVGPKHRRHIELVLSPGHAEAVLWQPGACLAVRANKPGQLLIDVTPSEVGGSAAATVKLETLTQGEPEASSRSQRTADAGLEGLNVLGHVAGIGDVLVGADEWVAGPQAPARIEGLSIEWPDKPESVDILYSVKLARPHAASGRMMGLGDYAGTRGRALPIVGVTIELSGPGASDFQLVGEAAFLGSPLLRMIGRRISVAGTTGREPLVGFKLRLDGIGAPLQPGPSNLNRNKSSGDVRVFRATGARTSTRMESLLDNGPTYRDVESV
jgi:hypothetical protein